MSCQGNDRGFQPKSLLGMFHGPKPMSKSRLSSHQVDAVLVALSESEPERGTSKKGLLWKEETQLRGPSWSRDVPDALGSLCDRWLK